MITGMEKRPTSRTQEVKKYELELPSCSPLRESDVETFDQFYHGFLNKRSDDALSYLKVIHMLARDDLRQGLHLYAAQRELLARMLKEARYRDLLLSFPTTCTNIYELIFDYTRAYPGPGETPQRWLTEQARDFLDCTEMFRIDLDALLSKLPMMLPTDREALHGWLTQGTPGEGGKFLLLLLADQPFVVLLGGREAPGKGILKLERYLGEKLGERLEEQLVEFFTIGGGFIRVESGEIVIGGRSTRVDPIIETPASDELVRLLTRFHQHKFAIVQNVLESEGRMPVRVQLPLGLATGGQGSGSGGQGKN